MQLAFLVPLSYLRHDEEMTLAERTLYDLSS